MEKKRIYPEQTPANNIPYHGINSVFRYRAIVPADDSIIMEVDANGVLYISTPVKKVETPVVGVRGRNVDAHCATEGAEIHYTTDGSMPSASSTHFTDIITVEETTNFRFAAFKNGFISSDEVSASANYLEPPIIEVDRETVTLINPNDNGYIHYTDDGTDPDENSNQYTEPLNFMQGETVIKAVVYDKVGHSPISEKTIVIE